MCDCLVALAPATAGGITLFAKNSDRPPTERQLIEMQGPRRDHDALHATHIGIDPSTEDTLACIISRPTWCWGAEHGVNEAGVAIGNEAIYTTLDPRSAAPALIGMDLVRLGLERATSAQAALSVMIELLERYGQGGSGHDPAIGGTSKPYWSSFLIVDPTDAWVLETSGRTWATLQVATSWALSNRTTIPDFDREHRHPRQPVERLVDPRLNASRAALATGDVSVRSLIDHLSSHDSCLEPGWSVCMHADGIEQTTASMIAELPAGGTPTAWMLTGSPCIGTYRPFSFPIGQGSSTTASPAVTRPVANTKA